MSVSGAQRAPEEEDSDADFHLYKRSVSACDVAEEPSSPPPLKKKRLRKRGGDSEDDDNDIEKDDDFDVQSDNKAVSAIEVAEQRSSSPSPPPKKKRQRLKKRSGESDDDDDIEEEEDDDFDYYEYDVAMRAERTANEEAHRQRVAAVLARQCDEANQALTSLLDSTSNFRDMFGDIVRVPEDCPHACVRHGDGPADINDDVCKDFLNYLRTYTQSPLWPEKGFKHFKFSQLLPLDECRPFLDECKRLLSPLLKQYRVYDFFVVLTCDNAAPMHQDVETGKDIFDRNLFPDTYGEGAVPGIRLLIDVAALTPNATTPPRRAMKFALDSRNNIVFETRARFVAMDANTAGSGRRSNIFHGRFGNGVTASVDLRLPTRRPPGAGIKMPASESERDIRAFFHGTGIAPSHQPNSRFHQAKLTIGELHAKVAAAQARAEVARALVTAGDWPMDRRHCWRCGSHTTRVSKEHPKWHSREVDGVESAVTFCDDCKCDADGTERRKQSTSVTAYGGAEPAIERLFVCPPQCSGCAFVAVPKYVPAATLASARAEKAEANARIAMQNADADAPIVLAALHCHFCGSELPEDARSIPEHWTGALLDNSDPPQQLAYCYGCRKQYFKKKERPTRRFSCAPQCTGCRRPYKMTLNAAAAARERTAAALNGRAVPMASDSPHCNACGTALPGRRKSTCARASSRTTPACGCCIARVASSGTPRRTSSGCTTAHQSVAVAGACQRKKLNDTTSIR